METNKKVITIAYCGPAVENGTMDVRDLAPALLAFSDFITNANKILNHDDSQISVKVNANFHKGSFEIELAVIKTLVQQLQGLWNTPGVDVGGLLAILGLGIGAADCGLIDLIKKIGGRVVKSITQSDEQPGKSLIQFEGDNNTIIVGTDVADLYRDVGIRKDMEKVLSPLKHEGINAFKIRRHNMGTKETLKQISKEESSYFEVPEMPHDITNVSKQTIWVKILNVSFEDLKWKLAFGDSKIHATLNDDDFKKQMDRHQVWFGKGDMLKVVLETTQYISRNEDISNQYAILKVEEVRHQKEETTLPFDD